MASVVVVSTNEVKSTVVESTDTVSTLVKYTDEVVSAVVKSICFMFSSIVVDSLVIAVSFLDVVSCCVVVSIKGDVVPGVVTFTPVIVSIVDIESVDIIVADSVIIPEVNILSYQENQFNMNRCMMTFFEKKYGIFCTTSNDTYLNVLCFIESVFETF